MWVSMDELVSSTGRSQPSLHRSLHDLVDSGIVIRESRKFQPYGCSLPKRYFCYMHVDNVDRQNEIEELKKAEYEKEVAEAESLGIDVIDLRLNKLFK